MTAVAELNPFTTLTQALQRRDAAQNIAFQLSLVQRGNDGLFDVPAAIAKLQRALTAEEMAVVNNFVAAREQINQLARAMHINNARTIDAEVSAFLDQFSPADSTGLRTFISYEKDEPVQMTVTGIMFAHYRDGQLSGTMNIQPQPHFSTTWSFFVKDDKIYVRTEDDGY